MYTAQHVELVVLLILVNYKTLPRLSYSRKKEVFGIIEPYLSSSVKRISHNDHLIREGIHRTFQMEELNFEYCLYCFVYLILKIIIQSLQTYTNRHSRLCHIYIRSVPVFLELHKVILEHSNNGLTSKCQVQSVILPTN